MCNAQLDEIRAKALGEAQQRTAAATQPDPAAAEADAFFMQMQAPPSPALGPAEDVPSGPQDMPMLSSTQEPEVSMRNASVGLLHGVETAY